MPKGRGRNAKPEPWRRLAPPWSLARPRSRQLPQLWDRLPAKFPLHVFAEATAWQGSVVAGSERKLLTDNWSLRSRGRRSEVGNGEMGNGEWGTEIGRNRGGKAVKRRS